TEDTPRFTSNIPIQAEVGRRPRTRWNTACGEIAEDGEGGDRCPDDVFARREGYGDAKQRTDQHQTSAEENAEKNGDERRHLDEAIAAHQFGSGQMLRQKAVFNRAE